MFPQSSLSRLEALLSFVGVFFIPELILVLRIVPFEKRYWVLAAGLAVCLLVLAIKRPSRTDLGLQIGRLKEERRLLFVSTVLVALVGYFLLAVVPALSGHPRPLYLNYWYYLGFAGLVLVEQVLCTAFLFQVVTPWIGNRSPWIICAVTASIFGGMHAFFGVLPVVIIAIASYHWHLLYVRTRSVLAPCIPHFVQGSLFILHCYLCK